MRHRRPAPSGYRPRQTARDVWPRAPRPSPRRPTSRRRIATGIDVVTRHDVAHHRGEQRGFALLATMVFLLEPVPATRHVGPARLPRVQHSTPCFVARSFMRVPAAKSSGDCVQPCSITTSGRAAVDCAADGAAGTKSLYGRVPARWLNDPAMNSPPGRSSSGAGVAGGSGTTGVGMTRGRILARKRSNSPRVSNDTGLSARVAGCGVSARVAGCGDIASSTDTRCMPGSRTSTVSTSITSSAARCGAPLPAAPAAGARRPGRPARAGSARCSARRPWRVRSVAASIC